jgi:uncharacterized protein
MKSLWSRPAAALRGARPAGRGRLLIAIVGLALLAGAVLLALRLEPEAGPSTLAGDRSPASGPTEELHRSFGEEPILVLVEGSEDQGRLPALLLTEDLRRMLGLEGCLSGNLPRRAKVPDPVCRELAREKPIQVVYGPGTFINESARQIAARFNAERARGRREAERAAEAARKVAAAQGKSPAEQESLAAQARALALAQSFQDALGLALRYGLSRVPQLNDPDFVLRLVFEPSLGFSTPKPRFGYLFPTDRTALIQARLRPGLSDAEQRDAIALVRRAVSARAFRLERGDYRVSGEPVVEQAVEEELPGALWLMLAVGVALVGLALLAVTRSPAALRVLVPTGMAALLAYGLLSLLGGSLTFGSIAALPVLLGVGAAGVVLIGGRRAAPGNRPLLEIAAALVAIGFATLLLSPVPLTRTFGLLVAGGALLSVLISRLLGIGAGPASSRAERAQRSRAGRSSLMGSAGRAGSASAAKVLAVATRRPGRVLLVALVVAIAGWVLSTRTEVVSGIDRLASADLAEVEDASAVRKATGSDGQVSVLVHSQRLTSPAVLRWMAAYQRRVLAQHGFRNDRICQAAELCPALSLPNLLGPARNERQVRAELRRLPPYFARALITPDRRTANMSFTIGSASVERQHELFDDMRAELDPPPGVSAELAGPLVMVADAGAALETNWIALAAVALTLSLLLLLAAYRSNRWALVPLLPVALATGWSALVLFLLPVDLNPLTAGLAALVVGFGGAVSATLAAGYRRRREAGGEGAEPSRAFAGSFASASPALLAGLAIASAGLLALVASDQRALRQLGWLAVVDVGVVLVAITAVLPAALVWEERRRPLALRLPQSPAELAALLRSLFGKLRSFLGRARSLPGHARSLPGRARALPAKAKAVPAKLRSLPGRARRRWSGRKRPRRRGLRRRSEGQQP